MKRQILLSAIVLAFLFSNAVVVKSQSLVATYTDKKKTEQKLPVDPDPKLREMLENAGTHTKELTCSAGTSMYKEKQKEMDDSPEHMVVIRIGDDDLGSVYKNLKEQKLIKQQEFFGRSFIIREKLASIPWTLQNEQKTIGKYNCRKASAVIDSANVVAWYCPDIMLNDGPDVFWGLPGLILEVNVNQGKRLITLNSINFSNTPLAVELPEKGKEVTQQEYDAIKKEKMSEMRRNHPAGQPDKVEVKVFR